MSLTEILYNSEDTQKAANAAARLRRRQAHALSASLRHMAYSSSLQRVRSAASVEARVSNIAAAIQLGKDISLIETKPNDAHKRAQYEARLNNLMSKVHKTVRSFGKADLS